MLIDFVNMLASKFKKASKLSKKQEQRKRLVISLRDFIIHDFSYVKEVEYMLGSEISYKSYSNTVRLINTNEYVVITYDNDTEYFIDITADNISEIEKHILKFLR